MDIIEVEKGYHQTEQIIEKLASEYDNQVTKISGKKVSNVLYLVGDTREIEQKKGYVKDLPGVLKILNITAPYKNIAKIVSKDGTVLHRNTHIVEVKGADGLIRKIGAGKHIFFVGPDSVQDWEQTISIAKACVELGKKYNILDRIIFRAGAYKPRTKPTDWRGLGWEGVKLLDQMREETGLPYVTEIMDHTLADEVSKHADMLQIGTRNAQNFQLLEAVGQTKKPVILKRGFGNEASEWFSAAEYIANKGSLDIVLCERGVKTLFIKEGYCRNTPDLNVIPFVKKETILPVIFDPSHSSGKDKHIASNLLSSVPFGVDGTITETIHKEDYRKEQKCDAAQALLMSVYEKAVQAVLSYEENVASFTTKINEHFESLQQKLD